MIESSADRLLAHAMWSSLADRTRPERATNRAAQQTARSARGKLASPYSPHIRLARMSRHADEIAGARQARPWVRLSDEQLLTSAFAILKLSIRRSPLARTCGALYADLERRGVGVRPHVWLSEEWFAARRCAGIRCRSNLAHRVWSGSSGASWEMRGRQHTAAAAYPASRGRTRARQRLRLRRRKSWRAVFGPASAPYPARYRARPAAGLRATWGEWYAQRIRPRTLPRVRGVADTQVRVAQGAIAGWPCVAQSCGRSMSWVASVRGVRPPVRNARASNRSNSTPDSGAALSPQARTQPPDPARTCR